MSGDAIRREVGRLAGLLGVCAFAITQPVLDVFGDTPEQFVFRGASTADIVLFPLIVAIVPALLLWLPGLVAGLVSDAAGRVAHLAAMAAALFVGLLQVGNRLFGTAGVGKVALEVVAAGAALWLYHRFEGARVWAQMMSLSVLLFVGLFLFSSPSGKLAFADAPEPVDLVANADPDADTTTDHPTDEVTEPADDAPRFPPIVMIVLDSLPTAILLDDSGQVDPIRYPALAGFAADATWYRTYTTISAKTSRAIPAMLSGTIPGEKRAAVWTRQPDTIFRLLGGTYHLTVSEALTQLCPQDWCGTSPISPPPPTTTAATTTADAPPTVPVTTTTTVPPETVEFDRGGLSRLLGDAVDVWRDQIALEIDELPVLTGFEETVVQAPPSTTSTSTSTTVAQPSTVEVPTAPVDEVIEIRPVTEDRVAQLPRVDEFRAAIAPSSEPTFYYLHLVLPHAPYVFTETGSNYDGGPIQGTLTAAEWDSTINAELLSLQMRFTDQLVGDVLRDVREAGLYDDALVVIVSDHAAGLDETRLFRYYDGTNASELMVTPLFIKAPNQTTGVVSDAPIEAIDLLPTLADMLDIVVPWDMDGESVLDGDPNYVDPGCDDVRHYVRFGVNLFGEGTGVDYYELCANDVVPRGLVPRLGVLRPDDEWATAGLARLTPFEELLGRPWDELDAAPGQATVTLDRQEQTLGGTSPPVGVVRGTIDATIAAEWVVVGVDGRVAGISPIYDRRVFGEVAEFVENSDIVVDETNQFTVIVPAPLLREDGYEIRVAAVEAVEGDVVATELEIAR